LEAYEYRRYQAGAAPAWTPLRFPGQYFDAETDLFENWNRYYDPSIGRYLQPEPMAANPQYIKGMAQSGMSVPVYAYAFNNPLHFTDPTGLYGTNSCDYYRQRCQESGGDYYCKQAPYWCEWFPKQPDPDPSRDDDYEGWPRCTRQCLQECDAKENKDQNQCPAKPDDRKGPWDPRSSSFDCHQRCYRWCGLDPTYPRPNWPHQRPF
jgi:RHS repeat-associated protein